MPTTQERAVAIDKKKYMKLLFRKVLFKSKLVFIVKLLIELT